MKIIWSVWVGTPYPQICLFDDSLNSAIFSLLSPFPSVLCIPISTVNFITIHPVPALLILRWPWSTGAGRTCVSSQASKGIYSCCPVPFLVFQTRMERRGKQGVEDRGGVQRSYSLCLKADPIYLLIFPISVPPPSFQTGIRLLMGVKRHCLLWGTLQLLRSWEADTRINSLSKSWLKFPLPWLKLEVLMWWENRFSSWPKPTTCQKSMRLGNLDTSAKSMKAGTVLHTCWVYMVPSGFEIQELLGNCKDTALFVSMAGAHVCTRVRASRVWGANLGQKCLQILSDLWGFNSAISCSFKISSIINYLAFSYRYPIHESTVLSVFQTSWPLLHCTFCSSYEFNRKPWSCAGTGGSISQEFTVISNHFLFQNEDVTQFWILVAWAFWGKNYFKTTETFRFNIILVWNWFFCFILCNVWLKGWKKTIFQNKEVPLEGSLNVQSQPKARSSIFQNTMSLKLTDFCKHFAFKKTKFPPGRMSCW